MYDWEFHDDMIDLWLFMMDIMLIILELLEEVWLGKDWRLIQHSQNCICQWGVKMYDWEFHDDMIDSWLSMMCIMVIILEIQEEVWLGKDWSSIQRSQNWFCQWGVNNVWLGISWWYDWFMIIYDEYNDNHIGDSVKQKLSESWGKRSRYLSFW